MAKQKELTTEVTDAPDVDAPAAPSPFSITDQTRAEQELGAAVARANADRMERARIAREKEEAEKAKAAADDEKDAATRAAKRLEVFPHASDQQVKP